MLDINDLEASTDKHLNSSSQLIPTVKLSGAQELLLLFFIPMKTTKKTIVFVVCEAVLGGLAHRVWLHRQRVEQVFCEV
jgi:hypothetical protein